MKKSRVNKMYKLISCLRFYQLLVVVMLLFTAGMASAVEQPWLGEEILRDAYRTNIAKLEKNSYGFPLFLESFERDDRVYVDVYGIFDYPFSSVVNALKVPANWCDIVALHPNVKTCTYKELQSDWLLTFYIGTKGYQPPEETHQVIYHYRKVEQQQSYLDITLNADTGPFGTEDHRLRFEALLIDEGRTFVHVSYSYSDSVALHLVQHIYFATLGWGKIGFTETGTDKNGKPVYIGGPRGSIERNAVRYYFAIHSFLNSLRYPEESRFKMRINDWYDHTSIYRNQLFDMEKESYLTIKITEHKNQLTLQQLIGTGIQ